MDRIRSNVGNLGAAAMAPMWVLAPALAFAQESEPDHVVETVEHGTDATHSSPNLFSVDPGLLIWTIVTFVVVLIVLRFTAWTPLVKSLAERQQAIEGSIEDARRIKTDAEAVLAKYEHMLAAAKDEARGILDEARADGRRVQEEIRAVAQKEATEFKDRALREIELQKDAAVQEIWTLTANLSTDLASRIVGRKVDGSDQDRLVKELIDQMKREMSTAEERTVS